MLHNELTVRHVPFQGTPADATAALAHLTEAFLRRGCTSHSTSNGSVELRLPLGGTALLMVTTDPHLPHGLAATVTVTDPGGADSADLVGLLDVVDAVPFTDLEVRQIGADLPILSALADLAGPKLFVGVSLLVAIHHMRDFTAMLTALLHAGADPSAITVLDKGYPYSERQRVDGWLRHRRGVTVIDYPSRVEEIAAHLDRAAASDTRTLVIDDGGYVLPVVLEHYPHRAAEIIGVVEQTTSGIWKLDPFEKIPVPVFSVAESALKQAVEAPHVAAAAINATMNWAREETWAGRPALVIGYGRLGRQAAHQLRDRHRMRVAVHDQAPALLVTAHQDGFLVGRHLPELIKDHRPLLVLGCSGHGGLAAEDAAAFTSSAYLASMTSRDYEFPLTEWASQAERVIDRGRAGHGYLLPGGVELLVVGDGLPVNFHHHQSVPNRVIDLVFAALFTGARTLVQPGQGGHGPGTNVPLVDEILAASPALGHYLDLYADDQNRRLAADDPVLCGAYARSPWRYGTL